MIVEDGYNRGRNYIVERATLGSHWKGMWWKADVDWREGLLERGKRGASPRPCTHEQDLREPVGVNHGIEQDGRVAILTVYRL